MSMYLTSSVACWCCGMPDGMFTYLPLQSSKMLLQNACVFRNQGVKEQNPKLSITVRGPGQSLTVATISQMSPADFSSLWTVCAGHTKRQTCSCFVSRACYSTVLGYICINWLHQLPSSTGNINWLHLLQSPWGT